MIVLIDNLYFGYLGKLPPFDVTSGRLWYSYRPGIYIAKNIYETANEFPTMVIYIVERNKFHQA
jgi:hypothetical protein